MNRTKCLCSSKNLSSNVMTAMNDGALIEFNLSEGVTHEEPLSYRVEPARSEFI